jgi:hypothetical protein
MVFKVIGVSKKSSYYYQKRLERLAKFMHIYKSMTGALVIVKFEDRRSDFYASVQAPVHKSARKNPEKILLMKVFKKSIQKNLMTKILIHELIHIKQYMQKKLFYIRKTLGAPVIAYWRKKSLGDISKIPYEMQPWEQEAEEKTEYYYEKYLELIANFRNR